MNPKDRGRVYIKIQIQPFHSQSETLGESKVLILWTEPLSVTTHWKALEQYFTVVLFVFKF